MKLFLGMWVAGLMTACVAPGERAGSCPYGNCPSGQTTCPAGETCSDKTPNGLYFSGAHTCDGGGIASAPMMTATGGTQWIYIEGLDGLPFDVAVAGDAFTVDTASTSSVRITGAADGTAELRLLEPGTDLLYDRVALSVATATSATIQPCDYWDDGAATHELWGGSDQTAAVYLVADSGGPLADEQMQLQTPVGATPRTWSTFVTTAPIAAGPLTIDATLSSGAMFHPSVTIADRATDIAWVATTLDPAPPSDGLAIGDLPFYTFEVLDGANPIEGIPIAPTTNAPIAAMNTFIGNVVAVTGQVAGDGHLTLTAGGAQRTFEIPVRAKLVGGRARSQPPARPAPASMAGERAAAANGD